MKCPYCGQEHPDNTKFCPETGNKLKPQSWVCSNPDCDYREPLPISAKFCPNCGYERPVQNCSNLRKPLNTMARSSQEQHMSPSFLKRSVNYGHYSSVDFFTLNGIPIEDMAYDEIYRTYYSFEKSFIGVKDDYAYYITNQKKIIKIQHFPKDNYEDVFQGCAAISECGHYIIISHDGYATVYKIESDTSVFPIFRFVLDEDVHIYHLWIIGDYITYIGSNRNYESCCESINYKSGETLILPRYNYALLLGYIDNNAVIQASNNPDMSNSIFVGLDGKQLHCIPYGFAYYVPIINNYLIFFDQLCFYGLCHLSGGFVIPNYFSEIRLKNEDIVLLRFYSPTGEYLHLHYSISKKELTITPKSNDGVDIYIDTVILNNYTFPNSKDDFVAFIESLNFGGGISSVFWEIDGRINRKSDNTTLCQLSDDEVLIGACDKNKTFAVCKDKTIYIYDIRGTVIKELYYSKGIRNARLHQNGFIIMNDNAYTVLRIVSDTFSEKIIKLKEFSNFNPIIEMIPLSSNCIAICRGDVSDYHIKSWYFYTIDGVNLNTKFDSYIVQSFETLNEQYIILNEGRKRRDPGYRLLLDSVKNSISSLGYYNDSDFNLF